MRLELQVSMLAGRASHWREMGLTSQKSDYAKYHGDGACKGFCVAMAEGRKHGA